MTDTLGGTTRRRAMKWAGFFTAGVMGAVLGNTAFSVARADFGGGHGFGGHGFFRGHGGDPAKAGERAQMAVDVAFRMVGASDDQRAQGKAIVARHVAGAATLHARHATNRHAGLEALTGATVDRAKLESVRKAQLQLAEEASLELTDAAAELAEVLTPEQRAELATMAARFHR
jgi:periplasmic protein CpxP/Spy